MRVKGPATIHPQPAWAGCIIYSNEGEEYARETVRVLAASEDEAKRLLRLHAENSTYDDPRIPDRQISISVEPAEEGES